MFHFEFICPPLSTIVLLRFIMTIFLKHTIGKDGIAVILWTYILEIPGSALSQVAGYIGLFFFLTGP
jgi:hypothetical protein